VHTIFKILSVVLMAPFYRGLEKLACLTIRDKKGEDETVNLLDERLLDTPAVAVGRAYEVAGIMAQVSTDAMFGAMKLAEEYNAKLADKVRDLETEADKLEDALGSYLVKLSACSMDEKDSNQVTKLLRVIGDYERISDHAVNIVESIEELESKKDSFSQVARHELNVLDSAIKDILVLTREAYLEEDLSKAADIESLEQVVDDLMVQIKKNHTARLKRGECTTELGFVLNDLLIDFERVSDHCSNIGSCIVEVSTYGALDMHRYLADLRHGDQHYQERYQEFKSKYIIE
jgi:phosphate:Na+ symporter